MALTQTDEAYIKKLVEGLKIAEQGRLNPPKLSKAKRDYNKYKNYLSNN